MVKVALRYACIAAWLARLGLVRFCLARVAGGSHQLAWAATSAFGAGVSSAVQRIAGEIRKLPAPILPVVRGLWSQPKSFLSLGQHVAALPVSAAQAAALSSLSSRGRHVVASDAGHWIHLDRPELVTQAIREVVAAARYNAGMEASTQTVQQ